MKSRQFSKLYRLHQLLGLLLAIPLFLIFISGVALVFRENLAPNAPALARKDPISYTLTDAVAHAEALYPLGRILAISIDDSDPLLLTVRVNEAGERKFRGAKRVVFDLRTGPVVSRPDAKLDGFAWLAKFHREFLLGFWGKVMVGCLGLLMLVLLLIGWQLSRVLARRIKTSSPLLPVRTRPLHRRLGTLLLPWLLFVTMTGILLSFSGQILRLYQQRELLRVAQTLAPHNALSEAYWGTEAFQRAWAAFSKHSPNAKLGFISFPDQEFSTPAHFIFVLEGEGRLASHLSRLILVDARSAQVEAELDPPWYLQAAMLAEPLHFGNFAGWPLQLAWVIWGCLATGLIASGPWMAWRRKSRKLAQHTKRQDPALLPSSSNLTSEG